MPVRRSLPYVGIFATLVLSSPVAADSRKAVLDEGHMEFDENCVACHAKDATGQGELAAKLIKPPKDLTTIAERNGGTFPFWRVFDIIAGDTNVPGHDTFQMPHYAQRMRGHESTPGFLPAHVRMLELTHYLESIQKK